MFQTINLFPYSLELPRSSAESQSSLKDNSCYFQLRL